MQKRFAVPFNGKASYFGHRALVDNIAAKTPRGILPAGWLPSNGEREVPLDFHTTPIGRRPPLLSTRIPVLWRPKPVPAPQEALSTQQEAANRERETGLPPRDFPAAITDTTIHGIDDAKLTGCDAIDFLFGI